MNNETNPYISNIILETEKNHSLKAEPNPETEGEETKATYYRPYSAGFVSRMLIENLHKDLRWSKNKLMGAQQYLKTPEDVAEWCVANEYEQLLSDVLYRLRKDLWSVSSEESSLSEKKKALTKTKEKWGLRV